MLPLTGIFKIGIILQMMAQGMENNSYDSSAKFYRQLMHNMDNVSIMLSNGLKMSYMVVCTQLNLKYFSDFVIVSISLSIYSKMTQPLLILNICWFCVCIYACIVHFFLLVNNCK